MEKIFKIEVDCANCAAKMERGISKIKGVKDVSINFMTQKAFIDAEEKEFERIIEEANKIVSSIEKDGSLVEC